MRGDNSERDAMFSCISRAQRVPKDHLAEESGDEQKHLTPRPAQGRLVFTFALAAYNLVRIRHLIAVLA